MVDCAWINPEKQKFISPKRKYIAISIKHTRYKWKFGMPCTLWGYHITDDDEPRSFGGYTCYLDYAERYAIGEFQEHGYPEDIVKVQPVPMTIDLCKRWKNYDTVLVEVEDYRNYCKMSYLATHSNEE